MKPLPAADIRERFLKFFEERGHARMPSDSLVPSNDPTLLFTGAGMNQFKDMFLGKGALPHKRVTTAQKCLRVPDLENVGATPRHHTFFEMLGNFSFGDYFKQDCIRWEWEFFTEELGIPKENLVVTVYQDDDEAAGIWQEEIGLDPAKIFRFGEKENFWPAEAPSKGPNGPCGPCSEIYYDSSPEKAYPAQQGLTELPEGRFTEIGNCVFTEFDRQEGGKLQPLPQKNIDVGLGLERIAAVLAGVDTNFETDLFLPYIAELERRSGKSYGQDIGDDVRLRRISDHLRAIVFCIADGALPSNEGRGYVVRKILRRAARDGFDLGIEGAFLHEMVDLVAEVMGDAYPEVREHAAQCRSIIKGEEQGFATVYGQGMKRLQEALESLPSGDALEESGEFAFQLHDTHGFPVDITRQILAERGMELDEAGFTAAMEAQKDRARAASATSEDVFAGHVGVSLREAGIPATEFLGYEDLSSSAQVLGLLDKGDKQLDRAEAGQSIRVVFDRSPFYAQGGGQVGDRGWFRSSAAQAEITNTSSIEGYYLHDLIVREGRMSPGQEGTLVVDEPARRATERNHTATHLLHAALKNNLGQHVSQAGSEVAPERLRFDYTHGERLSNEQIAALEDEVNREIMCAEPVVAKVRGLTEAKEAGFVAMFGEKYGDQVRTLSVGDYSRELCGGTHVANSGMIGSFRILSDSAISAGTRRIEAITGAAAARVAREEQRSLQGIAAVMKIPVAEVHQKVLESLDEAKRLRRELARATAADVGAVLEDLRKSVRPEGAAQVAVYQAKGLAQKELQDLMTRASKSLSPFAGVVFVPGEAGVLVAAAVDPSLHGKLKAGDLVKAVTGILGGGGGGRPEMAQGKGRDASKLPEAMSHAESMLSEAGSS
ncbi:MAG: alanine--tRNA ligase [Planctomycetota bacterium]|jgi:alanyl-tRNA synthetase